MMYCPLARVRVVRLLPLIWMLTASMGCFVALSVTVPERVPVCAMAEVVATARRDSTEGVCVRQLHMGPILTGGGLPDRSVACVRPGPQDMLETDDVSSRYLQC